MEYRKLGNSGLKVSAISLGGNTFSRRIDEQTSLNIIHQALSMGINYIDTADTYDLGGSEKFVGKAIQGKRSEVILATKCGKIFGSEPNARGISRYHILRSVEASLKRLHTDFIDLYQMHEPDSSTPIEETLRALDDLVRSGKIRYIGTSNFAAWQICEALWTSKVHHLNSFVTEQSRYNLLDRAIEKELVPFCREHNIGIIPWGPLAGGFLTGKYRPGEKARVEWRLADGARIYGNVFSTANWSKLAGLEKFAAERDHSVGELAVAWLLAKPWISTVIVGTREVEQVVDHIRAGEWKLSPEEVAAVDALSEP